MRRSTLADQTRRVETWDEVAPEFQKTWERDFGPGAQSNAAERDFGPGAQSNAATTTSRTSRSWQETEPVYRYGYEMAARPNYSGRRFNEVESDLRQDWERNNRRPAWGEARGTVEHAWNETNRRLQLREEQLVANKERVQAGEVAIGKRVVEEQKTLEVPVTRQEVFIERHAVDRRPVAEPIAETGEVIRVPVTEERVNVEKQTVVTGEIEVGKRAVQETQRVSDTLRREEAVVEREGDVRVAGEGVADTTRRAADRVGDAARKAERNVEKRRP